jgi:hypothetical protein
LKDQFPVILLSFFLEISECGQIEEYLSKVTSDTDRTTQQDAAKALIQRIIGARSNEFNIIISPQLSTEGKDVFKVSCVT